MKKKKTQYSVHGQHSLWLKSSTGQMAAIRMANGGLIVKLAEHKNVEGGLVANIAMATSMKNGGNVEWEKKG